jgi:hypothetical protein
MAATASPFSTKRRDIPLFASAGGLMSYGNDLFEQSRQAAGYVDRILRGANAALHPEFRLLSHRTSGPWAGAAAIPD